MAQNGTRSSCDDGSNELILQTIQLKAWLARSVHNPARRRALDAAPKERRMFQAKRVAMAVDVFSLLSQ
jgi:hypothetical protein